MQAEFFTTKDECKYAANIIHRAKNYLWVKTYREFEEYHGKSYASEYICDCVRHVDRESPTAKQITKWIDYQLEHQFGLVEWLRTKQQIGIEHYYDQMTDEDFLKLQRTRIAWMDWMIKELEAKAKRLK